MSDRFVSLHNHCKEGSLLDAIQSHKELIDAAKKIGQTSVALTDHGAVNAIFDAHKYAKTQGIKLIAGNEFYFRNNIDDKEERGNKHLVLIARNHIGWKNILKLNYMGWKRQKVIFMKSYPIITWDDIKENGCEGIIALTACSSGILSRDIMNTDTNTGEENLHCHIRDLKHIFGDNLFLEVQPHSLKVVNDEGIVKVDQVSVNNKLIKMAREYDIKLVSTCDAHYLKGDAGIHDMLLAIKDKKAVSDENRHRYSVDEFYLKSGNAMVEFFGNDLGAELINNSQMISERCDNTDYLDPPKSAYLPTFPVDDAPDYQEFKKWREKNIKTTLPDDVCYLRYKTAIGWAKKYEHLEAEQVDECYHRLKTEMGVIEEKGFSSYMLMVTDFIEEAKRQGNPSGYGRGSVAGSLVSYLTGITKVDPLKHKLLFERFLNKYKTSYPDIDMEFFYPEKIMDYAKKKYGEKRVAQISNIMVMTPKVVVKDVARSLELGSTEDNTPEEKKSISFRIANDVTKSMPDTDTIEDAMRSSAEFSSFMKKYPELLKNCSRLQNIERQNGIHAAGIVVANEDLDQIAPLRCDKEGNLVLAYDKDRAEEAGFIKFDFLGLETLGILDETIKTIHARTGKLLDLDTIPTDDPRPFSMISKGDVKCVFQLGLTAAPTCKAIKPKSIDEIAIITAIIRPSVPVEQRKAYIDRKNGIAKVELLHPKLAETTRDTFGEVLYEEQLMTLARDICGWDLNKADSLRKITKMKEKGKELAEKTRKEFVEDAFKVNGIDRKIGGEIWDHYVANFTGYGFNLSHAVSYSYLSYFTAWFKCYYPTEFMCAMINSKDPNSDKLQEYKQTAREMSITILPPDIDKSDLNYMVVEDRVIRTGLLAIKGIGEEAIHQIINSRPYPSFPKFISTSIGTKGNKSHISKTVIESLAKVGGFDNMGITRKNVLEYWEKIKKRIQSSIKKAAKAEIDIDLSEVMRDIEDEKAEYTKEEILKLEMSVMGHYLSGTHKDIYGDFFRNAPDNIALDTVNTLTAGQSVRVEAVVKMLVKELSIKKAGKNQGKLFAKYLLEDINGRTAEITIWPDQYEKFKRILIDGIPIRAICEVNEYLGSKSLVLRNLEDVYGVMMNGRM